LQDIGLEVKFKDGKGKLHYLQEYPSYLWLLTMVVLTIDNTIVGNGSKGVALVGTYAWAYQKKKGVSPALKRLVITDMLEYGGEPVGELISEDDLL
jgi:hypothetical protein